MKYAILVRQSITMSIMLLLSEDLGRGPRKSITMDFQGLSEIGKGLSSHCDAYIDVFVLWHLSHSLAYCQMLLLMLDQ
jgi:hypothetical protein